MSESKSQLPPVPSGALFDDPEADVIFQSVDGVQFHLQRKCIEVNTGAFPPAEFYTRGEITHLTENSVVLETLFQFVYPQRHPDLDDVDFNTVAAVAEAAEKYEVFNAMNICLVRMKQFLPSNAGGILTYAVRHDYPKLIQESAPSLVWLPISVVLPQLPPQYTGPWIRYREAWDAVFELALKKITEMKVTPWDSHIYRLSSDACHACLFMMFTIIKDYQSIQSIQELNVALAMPRMMAPDSCLLSPKQCQYTYTMSNLCADISAELQGIPSFSTFFV